MIAEAGQIITDEWGNPYAPLSVKGIVEEHGKLWLRRNEWNIWELPGGRVEGNEQAAETVVRELAEELGLHVTAQRIVDFYLWRKDFGRHPVIGILTYVCRFQSRQGELELEGEAGKTYFGQFSAEGALGLDDLPEVYKRAIRTAYAPHHSD